MCYTIGEVRNPNSSRIPLLFLMQNGKCHCLRTMAFFVRLSKKAPTAEITAQRITYAIGIISTNSALFFNQSPCVSK